jgi:import inner membrane translocase subunit TIM23
MSLASNAIRQLTLRRTYATGPATAQLSNNPTGAEVNKLPEHTKLPWNDYLHLRKQRHRAELIASVPSAFAGLVGGFSYFATLEIDPSQLVFGLDPLLVYGGATVGCGALGWLLGPTFGSAGWKLVHRKKQSLIEEREREFYQHIKRVRPSPAKQSFSNPLPDFYCEKVGSLHEYRRWLRDIRIFKRKSEYNL